MATSTKTKPATKAPVTESAKAAPRPTTAPVVETVVLSPDEIAAMSKEARLSACKPERAALAAWKAAGRQGDRPITPIMSWMENPTVARPSRTRSARAEFVRTPEMHQKLTDIVLSERPKGTSWNKIAKLLEAAEVPSSARGTQWFNKTAFSAAQRLGLVETGETLNRRDVPKPAVVEIKTVAKTPAKKVTPAKKATPAKGKVATKKAATKSTARAINEKHRKNS